METRERIKQDTCPNCGAAIDPLLNKCPYCGVSYFDLTSIDFTNGTPIYLKIKTDIGIITQKCVPYIDSIIIENNTRYAIDCKGRAVSSFVLEKNCTTDVRFKAIVDNGVLFSLQKQEVIK